MITATMKADNPGEWMYHCHVADHIDAGMLTSYTIEPLPSFP
jgi:FtsP/CotA-like multicopper oxidase with cupredoxin domain